MSRVNDFITDKKNEIKGVLLLNEAIAYFEQKYFKNTIQIINQIFEVIITVMIKNL